MNDMNPFGYVIVNVPSDGKTDVTDAIQQIIDDNPNRTIYFPDGEYLISNQQAHPDPGTPEKERGPAAFQFCGHQSG